MMPGTMTENAYQLDEEIQRELNAYYEHVVTENDQPVETIFSPQNNKPF